jgi:hypothetical protein
MEKKDSQTQEYNSVRIVLTNENTINSHCGDQQNLMMLHNRHLRNKKSRRVDRGSNEMLYHWCQVLGVLHGIYHHFDSL